MGILAAKSVSALQGPAVALYALGATSQRGFLPRANEKQAVIHLRRKEVDE